MVYNGKASQEDTASHWRDPWSMETLFQAMHLGANMQISSPEGSKRSLCQTRVSSEESPQL